MMRNHPKTFNASEQKKISDASMPPSCLSQTLDQVRKDRIVLSLIGTANTPHEISEFFANIYEYDLTYYGIRQILFTYADRIADLNHRFDLIASGRIRMIEIDETFKGRRVCFLVIVDAETGYLLYLHWLEARTEQAILNLLFPYRDLFRNIQVVLTDGALYYPNVVKILCPRAIHQTCLIHIMRKLFPFLLSFEKQFATSRKYTSEKREEFRTVKEQHNDRLSQLKCFQGQIHYWEKQRINYLTFHHLKPRSRILKKNHPRLVEIARILNEVRTKYRSMKATAVSDKARIQEKQRILKNAKSNQDVFWNQYMTQIRLVYQFYSIFQHPEIPFAQKEQHLRKILAKHSTNLSQEIVRILNDTPNLRSIYTVECPIKLTRAYINTNIIESTNSRLRPLLDKFKKWQDTPYVELVLSIFRLRLNASCPYSGKRKMTAPIERYGYSLRSRTWIDLIFDGLPPGPQNAIYLVKSNSEMPLTIDAINGIIAQ